MLGPSGHCGLFCNLDCYCHVTVCVTQTQRAILKIFHLISDTLPLWYSDYLNKTMLFNFNLGKQHVNKFSSANIRYSF